MQRSMFRVEVAPWNGRYVLTDETKGNISALKVVHCSNAASNQHSHYTQLSFSCMGMWVYTASQMAAFMNSKYWSVTVLDQDNTHLVREYAAWGFQRQKLGGFQHSNMVPLDLQNLLDCSSGAPSQQLCQRYVLDNDCSGEADSHILMMLTISFAAAHPKNLDQCQLILVFKLMLILSIGKMPRH